MPAISDTTISTDPSTAADYWREALGYPTQPGKIEIHLSAMHSVVDDRLTRSGSRNLFVKRWGDLVRGVRGHYRPCRGYDSRRLVMLPSSAIAVTLARDLIASDPRITDGSDRRRVMVVLRELPVWRRTSGGGFSHGRLDLVLEGRSWDELIAGARDTLAFQVERGDIVAAADVAIAEAAELADALKRDDERRAEALRARVASLAPDMLALLRDLRATVPAASEFLLRHHL